MKKEKGHVIKTIVFGAKNRRAAKTAVLGAFALRNPDNCEFYVVGETKAILANRKPKRVIRSQPASSVTLRELRQHYE